jgi:hypothetical protein
VLFNRAHRTERDLSELLGLAKGMLSDGVITEDEATYLRAWCHNHPAGRKTQARVSRHLKDIRPSKGGWQAYTGHDAI